MHITNDAVVVSRNGLFLGHRTYQNSLGQSVGLLDLTCTARMEVTNNVVLGAGRMGDTYVNLCNEGRIDIRDNASFYSHNNVNFGNTQCSTGVVTVAGHGSFSGAVNFYMGMSSNAVGRLVVQDDASVYCGGVLYMGNAKQAQGFVMLKDRATLSISPVIGNWLCLAPNQQDAHGRFEATDDAVVTLGNASSVEMTMGGTSRAELILSGNAQWLGGTETAVTNKSTIVGNTSVSLSSNARLSVRAVYGGSPEDGSPVMTFTADGGTLTFSGNSMPPVPFMSGCVARLGANGLTVDSKGFAMTFDQAFTAVEGAASATFTKTGHGTLTVTRNSSHPRTVLAQGALAFVNADSRFGNVLEIAEGARLVLADPSASIAADAITFEGDLLIDVPPDYTLDAMHAILVLETALTAEQLAKIAVGNPAKGRNYAFTLSEDGRTVSVTVTAATAGAYTWSAGTGAWHVSDNWTPTGVPTHNDVATVASGAEIVMDAAGMVGSLAVEGTAPVAVSGDETLYVAENISVVADGSLTVSAPVRSALTLVKDGSGTLTLAGANQATMSGDWRLNRGVTAFASAAALGADSSSDSAITISNCTFRYTGEAASILRPLRIAGDYCAVLDIVGDLTFNGVQVNYDNTSGGGIVKTGAGTLTLNVPAGTTSLSVRGATGRGSNQDVSGTFAPSNGEVSNWNGLGQFSVLDGKVLIQGKGKSASTVRQKHHGSVGGSGWNTTVAPELYLKDVTCEMGSGSGFHTLMDVQIKQGSPASKLILDNANLTANGLYVGHSKLSGNTDTPKPLLAITNSTLDITWQFTAPNNSGMEPVIRIGPGGLLRRASSTVAGGVMFNHKLDVRVEDGGAIEVASPQNLYLGSSAAGDLVLANGGGMKVHRFLARNGGTTAAVAFDGGYAQFTLNGGISTVVNPATTCFRADAGGGELVAAAGVSHALAIPLRGTGSFTKTGAGTLVFTNDLNVTVVDNVPVYSELDSTTVKIANGGGLKIAEGTVRCVAGTTDAASRFSGTGTLSGAFGTLTLDVDANATNGLTFADLTAVQVVVDFGRTAASPVPAGGSAVVAKIGAGTSFTGMGWKGVNLGSDRVAEFRCDANGVVTAHFRSTGLAMYIR
ncbi:MAG TPA: autotransporter-associated beta strand repeat-containing protein [Kiritimatiellia bacterium]|nr:autotransporter-associated beta strand repeat-containing protein [Kiritimatiellia bacterium]HRU69441.1 autotransporter-associated beta strand repeat-containing protein [Kiritimatiellia bacterium]